MKSAIGMYFADTHIHMAQVSWHQGQATVDRAVDCPWDRALLSTQSASIAQDIAQTMKCEGLSSNAPVIVGLPGDWLCYVPLETEAIGNQDLTQLLQFELEDDVPIPFENFQIDMMGTQRTNNKLQGLAAVCDRSEKDVMCHMLEQAGLNVQSMCPDLAGLDGLVDSSSQQKPVLWILRMHIESLRCLLILSQEGAVSIGRSLRCHTTSEESLTKELTPILRKVFAARLHGVKPEALNIQVSVPQICRSAVVSAFDSVWNGQVEIHITDELKHARKPSSVAEGLASLYLRGIPMPNFMTSQLTQKQLKKEMHFAGGLMTLLLVLLFVIWGGSTYYKIKTLQRKQAQLTQDIRAVFAEHLPEVKKIVQPATQMTNYVASYRKESEVLIQTVKKRALPLQVLGYVSQQINTDNDIAMTLLDIDSASVIMEGTAPSYESVESLADKFRRVPGFKTVQLGDVSANQTDGQVRFKLSIARGEGL